MKKISRVLVVALILMAMAVVIAACNKNKVEIYIAPEDMPSRTTFLVGQDIDLFDGTLTVIEGDQTSFIPLDSPDIKFSYDREKDGEVPVTIKYKGATTTITLTFVKRLMLENANLDYFVGESFNRDVGNLILTMEDGSSNSYPLSDSSIKIKYFDSSNVGTTEFEISYGKYTEKATANVHTLTSKGYIAPSKTLYKSHDKTVDVSDGYVLYKGNNGYERRIPLTQDMVSGFNPGHATMANREEANADPQTITIKFPGYEFETSDRGYTFEYNVSVQFSAVSIIKEYAKDLKVVEYNYDYENDLIIFPDENMLTPDLLAKSKEAVELYKNLEQEEKELITPTEKGFIIRPVAMTYFSNWVESLDEYKDTVIFDGEALIFVLNSYEQTKADYEKLTSSESQNKYYKYLVELLTNSVYEDLMNEACLTDPELDGVSFYDYFAVVNNYNETCSVYLPMIEKLLNIYVMLDETVVGKNWTYDTLTQTGKEAIEAVYETLKSSEMNAYLGNPFEMGVNLRPNYSCISRWRQNDDFFDIIYTYYYNKYLSATTDSEKSAYLNAISYIANYFQLPGELETAYNDVYDMYIEYFYINNYFNNGYYYEASDFMMYFLEVRDIINTIKAADYDNDMIKFVLNNVGISGLLSQGGEGVDALFIEILNTFQRSLYNYLTLSNIDIPEFDAMWNSYRKVLASYKNGEYFTTSETGEIIFTDKFKRDIPALFEQYSELSPVIQYGFTRSLSLYDISPYMVDQSSGNYYTTFGLLVMYYYLYYLPEQEDLDKYVAEMIEYLLYAQESLASNDIEAFIDNFEMASKMYSNFWASEISDLDNKAHMKSLYDKLSSIYRLYSDTEYKPNLSETAEAMFDKLYDYVLKGEMVVSALGQEVVDGESQITTPIFGVLVAVYEKIDTLAKNLIEYIEQNDDQELYNAYYFVRYDIFEDGKNLFTLEYLINSIRSSYINYLETYTIFYQGLEYYLYDIYRQSDIRPFVEKTADFLLASTLVEDEESSFEGIEFSYVKEILDDFSNFTLDEKMIYITFHQYYNMYYDGMIRYFADELGYDAGDQDNILNRLFNLEFASISYQYYYTYLYDMDELEEVPEELQKVIDKYNTTVEDFFAAYNNLDAASKAYFEDVFGDLADEYTKDYSGTNPRA